MFNIFYIDCLPTAQATSHGAGHLLPGWCASLTSPGGTVQQEIHRACSPPELQAALQLFLDTHSSGDVLIIAAHGHGSLEGIVVDATPVRWHDVASLLHGRMREQTEFIFYSCNGGYPGIAHIFCPGSGPTFVWGPRITVGVGAMRHATEEILNAHAAGRNTQTDKVAVVDTLHGWARTVLQGRGHDEFIRVWWSAQNRYPTTPSGEVPTGPAIPLLGWA